MGDTAISRALAALMSEISEELYCAGWRIGLEYALWKILKGGKRSYGMGSLSDEQLSDLKELSDACGGWITNDTEEGESFIPLKEWEEMYAKHQELHQ